MKQALQRIRKRIALALRRIPGIPEHWLLAILGPQPGFRIGVTGLGVTPTDEVSHGA